ncbi:MAG: hypothetical protein WCV90_07770 [Candidatus Woesearchaeota archaeon]
MDSIKITLETLYDVLRNEKKREDLQKLEPAFFVDVIVYMKEKIAFLEQKAQDKDIFASGERDKLEYELRSIRRILKEIYEKREKKIIDIALNKSRTGSDIIDISAMLGEEKEFYWRTLKNLDEFRRGILMSLFKGELPVIGGAIHSNLKVSSYLEEPLPVETAPKPELSEPILATPPELPKTKIKFTHPLPSFVWKDMKVYGPYDVGEEIEIFPEVADLIVRKGRAEKI